MDKTRSEIILYALTGIAALAIPVLFSDGAAYPLQLAALAPAALALALLALVGLRQVHAAHSLSAQLGVMIERRDVQHLLIPVPDCPEMSAVGHRLNVLIYTMAESANEARINPPRNETADAA